MEVATYSVINVLHLHSGRWRNLNLAARADIFERFSSSVKPKQIVTLYLTATQAAVWEALQMVPKFMMESELNPTHLKLTRFPLTSISIRWDNITHATFSDISPGKSLDFLRRAPSLEFYCVFMYGLDDIGLINPIPHPRLRSLDLSATYPENFLRAINLPSLEEWTMDMDYGNTVAAILSFLERSGCRLKVLNLDELRTPYEDIEALLEEIPSLERLRLSSIWRYEDGDIPSDILNRIFCSVPGSGHVSRENPTSGSFLPHLRVIECCTDQCRLPFSWDLITKLYPVGRQRSVTLKTFATHSDMTDETALRLTTY